MPMVGQARREGRAVVKNIRRAVTGLREAFLEDAFLLPEGEHFVLGLHKGKGALSRRCRGFSLRHGRHHHPLESRRLYTRRGAPGA